jgi:hypothetical protein
VCYGGQMTSHIRAYSLYGLSPWHGDPHKCIKGQVMALMLTQFLASPANGAGYGAAMLCHHCIAALLLEWHSVASTR